MFSPQKDVQEIVAALMLPGPFAASGSQGWNVRELAAVCPAVQEPHRASQILWVLGRRRITRHVGHGQNVRHYLTREGEGILKAAAEACWYPDRETLDLIFRNRQAVGANLVAKAAPGPDQIRAHIWEVWRIRPGVPLSKKDLMNGIREKYPDCPEHPVSQQLYELVRMGKLRQHHDKGITFIPVMTEDLVSLMDQPVPSFVGVRQKTHGKPIDRAQPRDAKSNKSAQASAEKACLDEHSSITGLMPEVEVFLLENQEDRGGLPGRRSIQATVTVDDSGRITQVYLEQPPLADDR